jgi:hypothetical protein
MRALPRLGLFLRIAPAGFEYDFWYRSEHQRRLALFLDVWSVSIAILNTLMVVRFMNKTPALYPHNDLVRAWAVLFLLLVVLQIAWMSLAPSSYQTWRFSALVFNRYRGCPVLMNHGARWMVCMMHAPHEQPSDVQPTTFPPWHAGLRGA